MHYKIHYEGQWDPCTCTANTPNSNLPSNKQCTQWQTEPDLAVAAATILANQEAAGAMLITNPVAGLRAAGATMIIKSPAPVAIVLTPVNMADNNSNLGTMRVIMRAEKTSRQVIGLPIMMSRHPHVKEHAY